MVYEILPDCNGCGVCLSLCPVKAIKGGPGRLHVIEADLCIGCGACGRVCPQGSVSGLDGQSVSRENRNKWLIPVFDKDKCHSCGSCSSFCPSKALSVPQHGEIPVLVNQRLCVSCLWCVKVCVFNAVSGELKND